MLPALIDFLLLVTFSVVFPAIINAHDHDQLKTYIVHLTSPADPQPHHHHQLDQWYNSFLSKLPPPSSTNEAKPMLVHAYHHAITGFAAKMSLRQAKAMENLSEDVISITPDVMYQLHTTHTSIFLGLRSINSGGGGFWESSNYGKGVILGVMDSGITPGHPSLDDKGVPSPPPKWKGKCELSGVCNNKLIGLRSFVDGVSPVDDVGHGSHTSSTAAGNWVDNANVFGQANGTASGMAPLAHLAMYRVCEPQGCMGSDILAGMDAAIEDGVDVMSISLGSFFSWPFYEDVIAIAAFTAMQKGIFVSCSAGNSGPYVGSLTNGAPWLLTVGASTIDRRIRTTVALGNKMLLDGESLYQPEDFDHKRRRPIVYPGSHDEKAAYCVKGSLSHVDVKGKVVVCDEGNIRITDKARIVKDAGGAAMIVANRNLSGETLTAEANVLPASHVGYKAGEIIKKYINSSTYPVATILFKGTIVGLKSNPKVAYFSSRGPHLPSPGVLKPDVIGPGVDILAAWNELVDHPQQQQANEISKAFFNVISGTSMSCPHVSGVAALLKSAHPDWSPAAIKSAIMTTAGQLERDGEAIEDEREVDANVLAIGSGHVKPSIANQPGLVFDIQADDYIPYLCGLNYTAKQIQVITKKTVNCSKSIPEAQLNYPSFTVSLKRGENKTYSRTVTNVGEADSRYTIRDVSVPHGRVSLMVNDGYDKVLSFAAVYQKLTYRVTFSRYTNDTDKGSYGQGHMTWVSGEYTVRTPFFFNFE